MFSSTKKLDPNLKFLLASSSIKDYRILIQYRNFPDSISKKIRSYHGNVIRRIESCNIICAQLKASSIQLLLNAMPVIDPSAFLLLPLGSMQTID